MTKLVNIIIFSVLLVSCDLGGGQVNSSVSVSEDSTVVMPDTAKQPVVEQVASEAETTHTIQSGETLWGLARTKYGNRHYSSILAMYNEVEVENLKVGTTINMPPLDEMLKSPKFGLYPIIGSELDKLLQARELFMKHEKQLHNLRGDERAGQLTLPENISTDLAHATRLVNEAIEALSEPKSETVHAPTKMIGQLKSVASNLQGLSQGYHDGPYGYDLDMVHQNLIQALKNGISWAKGGYSFTTL